ncbi:MAG: hypothetical protein F6J96_34785 [Symploca sp. SIO1C2]|nr:hypothetical protein [Symploca sp. SIO1C2]
MRNEEVTTGMAIHQSSRIRHGRPAEDPSVAVAGVRDVGKITKQIETKTRIMKTTTTDKNETESRHAMVGIAVIMNETKRTRALTLIDVTRDDGERTEAQIEEEVQHDGAMNHPRTRRHHRHLIHPLLNRGVTADVARADVDTAVHEGTEIQTEE